MRPWIQQRLVVDHLSAARTTARRTRLPADLAHGEVVEEDGVLDRRERENEAGKAAALVIAAA